MKEFLKGGNYGSKKMLIPMYASGAIALTLLGFGGNMFVIYLLIAVAGAATIGSQNIVQAYVSHGTILPIPDLQL